MNLKTKRIIILILDILIAIFTGLSFYKINDIQNIDFKYGIILLVFVTLRILIDFKTETIEEKSYELEKELILLKKQHEVDRLKTLNKKAMEALSEGNTKEFKKFDALIGN